jgi:hypothetical protein
VRVLVASPPFALLNAPLSAPSVLVGVLREAGHEAMAFDVSRACVDVLLQKSALTRARARIVRRGDSELVHRLGTQGVEERIEHAVALLRRPQTYGMPLSFYTNALQDVQQALALHAAAHGNSYWTSVAYEGDHDRSNPQDLLDAVLYRSELFDEPRTSNGLVTRARGDQCDVP